MDVTTISERLFEQLSEIDRPGSFCMQGSMPGLLPGLEIDGVGPIGFPLTVQQAKEIKKHSEQAPYGKGEQTIVDTKVRRVWQIMPDRFKLTNPEWPKFLAQMVKSVQQELGLEEQKLEAHLYNLLLYEKGSFFLPHRDGEKLDRMVATLVVVLPSTYQGGELLVRHEGQEKTIDLANAKDSSFVTHFAAFYADCEHELRPLTSGYRLCLVYNLTLAKATKPIHAPRIKENVEAIKEVLHDWQTDTADSSPRKLAILLEHQYTQDGVGWDALKGVDRARAQVLREAARQAGCKAYLALLTFWESGAAAYDDSDRGYYRRRGWHDAEDDYEAVHHEMEEVFESSLTAEHWTDDEGHQLGLGKMTVKREQVVPEDWLTDVEPEEAYEGYTGNEGMTLERWYRHAAIFLWPEKRHYEVLCGSGTENPVAALTVLVKKWQKAGGSEKAVLKAQCLDFTRHIIASWRPHPHYLGPEQKPEPCELVPALVLLDEPGLIQDFLSQVMTADAAVEVTPSLLKVCEEHGWSSFQDGFLSLFKTTTAASLPRNVRLLEQLCGGKWKRSPEWLALCGMLAEAALLALQAVDEEKNDWRTLRLNRAEILAALIRSLLSADQIGPLARLLAHISATPKTYPLRDIQIKALLELRAWLVKHVKEPCTPLSEWLAGCRRELESLTAETPKPPADFRRDAAISCHCPDCRELVEFLRNSQEKVHRFAVRKDRRQHLHQMIQRHQCDLEHVTERRGSPQTLVCTKNTASYQRRVGQYEEDKEHLAALRAMEKSLPANTESR